MLDASSPLNSLRQNNSYLNKQRACSVTFVIITKNRPRMIKRLIKSILEARTGAFSLVLIDDSNSEILLQTRSFLQSQSISFKQLSSFQAVIEVEETLEKTDLTANEKNFIRTCTGLYSPFCGYVERFLDQNRSKPRPMSRCLQFAPYSPARNLGIYCAVRFFNPDIIFF